MLRSACLLLISIPLWSLVSCSTSSDSYAFEPETAIEYTTLDSMGESNRKVLPKGQSRVLLDILAKPAVRLDKSDDSDPNGRPLGYVYVDRHVFARFEGHLEERLGRGAYMSWHDIRLVNFPRLRMPQEEARPIEASLNPASLETLLER